MKNKQFTCDISTFASEIVQVSSKMMQMMNTFTNAL